MEKTKKEHIAFFHIPQKTERRVRMSEIAVERLKSIRLTETLISGIVVKNCVSKPDEEQQKILDL